MGMRWLRDLGPSLPALPLVQDDRWRRGDLAPRDVHWDWVWDWVAHGWPLGGPSVAQAPPKGRARVE